MTAIDRAQWLADARAMLNMLEDRPEIPLPPGGLNIRYSASVYTADDNAARACVAAAAAAFAVDATTSPYNHYRATYTSGLATYEIYMVPAAEMARYDRRNELGEAALAEAEAVEQAVREVTEAVTTR